MALFRAKKQTGYDSWRLRVSPQVVEYSRAVLNEILESISAGRHVVPQGGLEVGGLLFGTGDRHLVKILAARPVFTEHAYGPQFLLSEKDHEKLREQIVEARGDPELQEYVPVGWYVSRVRGEIALRESDRQAHLRHFPEPWQIALVFREESDGSMSAGVFARGKDPMLPTEPTRLAEGIGVEDFGNHREPEPEPEEPPKEPPPAPEEREPEPEPEPVPFQFAAESAATRDAQGKPRWVGFAVVLALMLAAAGAAAILLWTESGGGVGEAASAYWQRVRDYWTEPPSGVGVTPLGLRLSVVGEQIAIRWNGSSPVLQQVSRATLIVRDGDQTLELPLEGPDLLLGSMTYEPQTSDVSVTLKAGTGGSGEVVDTARFIGSSGFGEAAAGDNDELIAEVERLRIALQAEERNGDSLRSTLRTLEMQAAAQPPAAAPPAVSETPPTLIQQPPRQPVVLEQRPAAVPGRPSPAASQPAQPGTMNESGTLIWTGLLEPGATLTIQGNRPSAGNLSGALPGTAVRVNAYPAEMASNGITVLSDDASLESRMRIEEAGPRNQGQRTVYRYDPEAAASLSIVDLPAASNGWNRIVLRAIGRPVSVAFIRWQRVR